MMADASALAVFAALVTVSLLAAMLMIEPIADNQWHESPWHSEMMRRKVNGTWQYRPMTDQEIWDKISSEAW